METLVHRSIACDTTIRVTTEYPTQLVDLTHRVEALVRETGIHTGLVTVDASPTSMAFSIADGQLRLGPMGRIILAELDGPRSRDVSVLLVGEAGR